MSSVSTLQTYHECLCWLEGKYGSPVSGDEFYAELFPENECSYEKHMDFSHPNALYLYRSMDSGRLRRRTMYADTWVDDYIDYVEQNPMVLCSGLVYRGKANTLANAQRMNALIIDLDGVGVPELETLFLRFGGEPQKLRRLPQPTFIVYSGVGVHVYYVFDRPIDLYPNIKIQAKALKYDLTDRMWDYGATSTLRSIQHQSINQGFRMVGSLNDKHNTEVVAFRSGERVSLDYLNEYVKPENRVDVTRPFRPSKISREAAKEAYPEWYQRVIIEGRKGAAKWHISEKVHGDDPYALYHWWIRQADQVRGGHRYFFLMCMAIYACKCDVPRSMLVADMNEIFQELQQIHHENVLMKDDVESALEAYDKAYYNFTIQDISALSGIPITRNVRKYRKQKDHLILANAQKKTMKENHIPFKNPEGRPSMQAKVEEWQEQHPGGTKAACHKDTGMDPKTIRKWWKESI